MIAGNAIRTHVEPAPPLQAIIRVVAASLQNVEAWWPRSLVGCPAGRIAPARDAHSHLKAMRRISAEEVEPNVVGHNRVCFPRGEPAPGWSRPRLPM